MDAAENGLKIKVSFKNEGSRRTKDVIQAYIRSEGSVLAPPNPVLCAFAKVEADSGEEKTIELDIPKEAFMAVNEDGERIVDARAFTLYAGTCGPDARSRELAGKAPVRMEIKIKE